jgi:DNA-binding MarR family transcriptional regulator
MGKKGKGRKDRDRAERRDHPRAETAPSWDRSTLAARLSSVAVHLLRRLTHEDAERGVSSARLSALSALVTGGPRSLRELAAAEDISPPSMTRLVSALEADGLVERSRSTVDGRRIVIRATPAGEGLLGRGRARRTDALAGWLDSASGRELDALGTTLDLLERVVAGARSRGEPGG